MSEQEDKGAKEAASTELTQKRGSRAWQKNQANGIRMMAKKTRMMYVFISEMPHIILISFSPKYRYTQLL